MDFDPGFLAVFVGSQLTTVALGTPFAGAMTRLRANWAPLTGKGKGAELGGILGTLQRTWDIEGVWGIFKGAYASTIASLAVSFGSAVVYFINPFPGDPNAGVVNNLIARLDLSPNAAVLAGLAASLTIGITLIPFSVLTSRSVVTPLRLPFSPRALRGLASARERAEPWRLWAIPGLIANYTLQTLAPIAITTVSLPLLYGVAAASSPQMQGGASPEYFGVLYVAANTATALWMVPLAVLAEKMAVARDDVAEASAAEAEFGRIAAEDVVTPRPAPRYSGLLDAWTTVKNEEGLGALYRGWMWSAIGLAMPAISQVMAAANAGRSAQM